MAFLEPVTLTGDLVVLEPLQPAHAAGLAEAAKDGELWTLGYTRVPTPERMAETIDTYLANHAAGTMLPFATRRRADDQLIGVTTYCNAVAEGPRVEIGYTWNARSAQRSGTNTDSKLLLLGHAFDEWGCIAVEFRTHWLNHQSRAAIARLGAKQDGVLRNHTRMPDGTLRDTVVFSIIASEWPAIRNELRRRMSAAAIA